ncbi:lycopene cyclase domain-containing protein [Leifsonia sp. NPDC058292]|uniref:lycopene cyclase domain-containing protein n=1 Tax=Leifsonia sp. NPDC058292 TaxID=3346428 RepID=UPI0036DE2505
MSFVYLVLLLLAIGSMVLIDRRFTLFLWRDARRAGLVLGAGLVFFLAWDVFGIGLHIFARGEGPYMTGVLLLPELPLEEVFFLTFLCYLTMVLIAGADRLIEARRRRHT